MSFSKTLNLNPVQTNKALKLNFRKRLVKSTSDGSDDGVGELTFNAKDLLHLNKRDVVRLTSAQNEGIFILLQVAQSDEFVPKNTVCISEDVISAVFPFKRYSEVYVEKVQPAEVSLDLLEMSFREQYISRSDMCRIRRFMLFKCVHLDGKVEFCLMRLKVRELWRKGECVSSGFVDENTRVVFRSSSALIFIFVQMSLEMWDYDTQGVCYYEKCVDGFLTELFRRWRDFKCSHYVTLVLFSRWFYTRAKSLQDFPAVEAYKIQRDFRGRFYQDFYQILFQNEHYEDWISTLGKIKFAFHKYNSSIQSHISAKQMPSAENSNAGDGNVLEALNMTFNVFSTHNVDRTFERTGQVAILVTPGGGVFNVDRTFANMTKQRNFDYGIAVDLVCLGEQPLHAVPLLIYHSKTTAEGKPAEIEDYFIMHWVNYSYYNPIMYPNPMAGNFRPRVRIPFEMVERKEYIVLSPPAQFSTSTCLSAYPDFDAYDNFVNSAAMPKRRQHKSSVPQISPTIKIQYGRRLSEEDGSYISNTLNAVTNLDLNEAVDLTIDQSSDLSGDISIPTTPVAIDSDLLALEDNGSVVGSCPINISRTSRTEHKAYAQLANSLSVSKRSAVQSGLTVPTRGFYSPSFTSSGELGINDRFRVGTAEGRMHSKLMSSTLEPEEVRRPLINPFKPSEFSVRITSNRRRWIHVFPVDSRGLSKQAHHSVAGTSVFYANLEEPDPTEVPEAPLVAIDTENDSAEIVAMRQKSPDKLITLKETQLIGSASSSLANKGKTLIWAWGCTGEEQWNPDIEIGTDWKSIIIPACLPITTDFFPDARSLKYDYFFSEHTILLDDSVRETWCRPAPLCVPSNGMDSFMTFDVDFRICIFNELVAQRLQHGFQVVLLPLDMLNSAIAAGCGPTLVPEKVCYLSISRIYHRLSLVGQCIYVTKFFPRHSYPLKCFSCLYECQVPDSNCYQSTTTRFEHEHLEKMNWSNIDNLVVSQGETDDYSPGRDSKFWEEARFFLLPSYHPATSLILNNQSETCDIYRDTESPDLCSLRLLNSFIKFMEILNRIRRPANIERLRARSHEDLLFGSQETNKILLLADTQNSRHALNFIQSSSIFGNPDSSIQKWPSDRLFVGAEFVHWLMCHVSDLTNVEQAAAYAQRLLAENKICHVSGPEHRRFVYGFYLYYFVAAGDNVYSNSRLSANNNSTNNVYEVAFVDKPCQSDTSSNTSDRQFRTYKFFFDPSRRSERQEWGQIRLNACYWPGCVFEVNFQWFVATGAIVYDCIMQLHRKSVVYPLCLLPVPKHLFALPEDPQSDPLRCPIFLALSQPAIAHLTQGQIDRLRLEILSRFGFVPMSYDMLEQQHFFHSSAGMSLMLRGTSGFLWKWNHALGRRYCSSSTTGDEKFLNAMLADFRAFCINSNDRLSMLVRNLFS